MKNRIIMLISTPPKRASFGANFMIFTPRLLSYLYFFALKEKSYKSSIFMFKEYNKLTEADTKRVILC